jgi:DUF1365 family protein
MNSCLYVGTIRHRRLRPVANAFQYRVFFCFLDLNELDRVFESHPLWSVGRVNLAYLRRRDHTGDPAVSLDRSIRDAVEAGGAPRPKGPIRMLTHLRYFGYCFNPVSFYYCYDAHGQVVTTIVAEIHNTPWGEEHLYVLDNDQNIHPVAQWRRYRLTKGFHISPFMGMGLAYDWRFRIPGKQLAVHMLSRENGVKLFDASLAMTRHSMTRRNLTRALIHFPAMTAKVTAMIYWQALRLLIKGAPIFDHPRKRNVPGERHRR